MTGSQEQSYDAPERIEAAAIWRRGIVWSVPRPGRHHHVIRLIDERGLDAAEGHQGFVTSAGRFVDRTEGLGIATAARQIIKKHPSEDQLYSEDMW